MYEIPLYRLKLVREGRTAQYVERKANNPEAAARVIRALTEDAPGEKFVTLFVNGQNEIVGSEITASGGLHGAAVGPADVFRAAIIAGATAIIVGHNHPSGDPNPSADDIATTKAIAKAGEVLGIPILDHVIVTGGRSPFAWRSLREQGVLR